MIILFLIAGLLAGMSVPIQTSINSRLGRVAGSPYLASTISMAAGALTLLVLSLAIDHRVTFGTGAFLTHPWWIWLGGGILGVFYLVSNVLLLPRLGAALTVVITVCGQMVMAICIDDFGWFGVPVHELNAPRLIGVFCMLAGIFLMRKF